MDHRPHDDRNELDGWRVAVNPVVRYVVDSQTLLEVSPRVEANEARADHRASRLVGIGIGVSRAFENGITPRSRPHSSGNDTGLTILSSVCGDGTGLSG